MKGLKCNLLIFSIILNLIIISCATTDDEEYPEREYFNSRPAKLLRHGDRAPLPFSPTYEDFELFNNPEFVESSFDTLKDEYEERDEKITNLENILKNKSKIEKYQRYKLSLELIELYSHHHDYLRRLEMSRYIYAYREWEKSEGKDAQPKLSFKKSREYLYKRSNILRDLARDFPNHEDADQIFHNLARALGRLGNENSQYYFKNFEKRFKKSSLLDLTYIAWGEYYYDLGMYDKAIAIYKKAMKRKNKKVYPYAVYKFGWAYYQKAKSSPKEKKKYIKKAVSAFKLVIALCKEHDIKGGYDLGDEALYDVGSVWIEEHNVNDAYAYFERVKRKPAFYDLLERYAKLLVEQKKFRKAIAINQRVIKESPLRSSIPDIYIDQISLYHKTKQNKALVYSLQMLQGHLFKENKWFEENNENEKMIERLKKDIRLNMYDYGVIYHEEATKNKDQKQLSTAIDLYKMYVKFYPKEEDVFNIHFNLASIYYNKKSFKLAAYYFAKVIALKPKDEEITKNSAVHLVAGLDIIVQSKKYPSLPALGKLKKPLSIPVEIIDLIKAIDAYASYFPEEDMKYQMRYRAAFFYVSYGHYKIGLERFEKLGLEKPSNQYANQGIKLVVAFYYERQDWEAVIAKCKMFLGNTDVVATDLRDLLDEMLSEAKRELANKRVLEAKKKQEAEVKKKQEAEVRG